MADHNITPGVPGSLNPIFDFEKSGIGKEDILIEAEHLLKKDVEAKKSKGLFTLMQANGWMDQAKTRPIPQMLFGEFWFEGELCILFADTNLGKSILAVQIGNSISKGEPIHGFRLEASQQKILYFDFEFCFHNLFKKTKRQNRFRNFRSHALHFATANSTTISKSSSFDLCM